MRFKVSRASAIDTEIPCKDAYKFPNKDGIYDSWYIDIDSLEQLEQFIKEYGDIIIYADNHICIYDTWVE